MRKYWKWYLLPSPKDLGMSDSDAMPSRAFPLHDGRPTWDDYHERVKKDYPARFFICETLVPWVRYSWRQYVTEPIYWLKCHVLPSYKFHMLDLRQPKPDGYRYGWIDTDSQMLYACFNLLNLFVEQELNNFYNPTEKDLQEDPSLLGQAKVYADILEIYNWWNHTRFEEIRAYDDAITAWNKAHRSIPFNKEEVERLWQKTNELDEFNVKKEDEMLSRLLKIRRFLWT